MDRDLIAQKLESLRRCVERVRRRSPATAAALANDPDAQDILTLNITRAVQMCVDLGAHLIAAQNKPAPDTMGQTFDTLADMGVISTDLAIRMKKSVGFRNIAVHNYEAIDWAITHAVATHHIDDFAAFATAVAKAAGI